MDHRHDTCDRCGKLCITKEDRLLGPLAEEFEYVCPRCARMIEMVHYPLRWKRP